MVPVAIAGLLITQGQNVETLNDLVRKRGEIERLYRTNPNLDVIRIGTSNLGNPYDEWFWPAGSAAYQITISSYNRVGHLALVGRKGKISTVLWAVKLKPSPNRDPLPAGTLARVIWAQGMRTSGELSSQQRMILSKKRGYAAFAWGRGPNSGDIRIWHVYPSGRLSDLYYDCYNRGSAATTTSILDMPPITPDESAYLGFPMRECYDVLAKAVIEPKPLSWLTRPELPDAIPNRGKLLDTMPRN
ncbi:MAG: hypothetical protein HONBIEJF_02290 [Fimbriimonadaceae bacterium]|nr:hypothetical protein [Fimbriimonadaceae bacterium]